MGYALTFMPGLSHRNRCNLYIFESDTVQLYEIPLRHLQKLMTMTLENRA